MAIGNTSATTAIGDIIYVVKVATATSDDDLSGSSTPTVYGVEASSIAAEINYIKLYDDAGPTVGTTAPKLILPIAANSSQTMLVMAGVPFGHLSVGTVQTPGIGGTSDPSGDISVEILVALS